MSFLDIAKKRYSVRSYQSKKVENDKLMAILEAAHVAPTAANRQPYKLVVVQEQEGLNKIAKAANVFGAPLAIIVCGDHNQAWRRPFDGKRSIDIDTSIITDHMLHQATDLGLGTLWVCGFKPDVIKAEFNIPEHLEPINILAVGYAADQPLSPDRHGQTRKPLDSFVAYEKM